MRIEGNLDLPKCNLLMRNSQPQYSVKRANFHEIYFARVILNSKFASQMVLGASKTWLEFKMRGAKLRKVARSNHVIN